MPLFVMTGEYLAELKPELLEKHIVWLTKQFEDGVFLVSGGVDAVDGKPPAALAILEAESREAALAILDTEPFYNAGAIRHEVAPFSARVLGTDLDERFATPELIRTVARTR
jgi:uncharacterized protein YciI